MVDRVFAYSGALPQTYDVLRAGKFSMFGLGYGMRMVLGTSTFFDGLECLPTSPTANLQVHVQVGSIYKQDVVDQAAYGDLGTDATTVYKQGINPTIQDLTITPPSTAGYSQVFLVQAILSNTDSDSTVLSYFNAGNPSSPYSGPANAGTSNYTTRKAICTIALKAGTAASTGTQTTPSPDAGYTGLYAVTVANGQTQITSNNIATLSTAPIIGPTNKLPAIPNSVQAGIWLYGIDTGTANAMAANVTPIPASLTVGMEVHIKAAATNTGATNLNLNGLGNTAVKRANGAALSAGDINIGMVVGLIYDGANWQIKNYFGFTSSTVNNNTYTLSIPYAQDTSTSSNSIIVAPNPALTTLTMGATQIIVKLANLITGPTTITINALAAVPVVTPAGQALSYGAANANEMLWLLYDGGSFQIINNQLPLQQNTTIYVSASIGNDSYDGIQPTVSGSHGPLRSIQTAINRAYNYPPSRFIITIQVADGTYNEKVYTPVNPGPTCIINGNAGNPSNVLITGANNSHTIAVNGPNVLYAQNLKVSTGTGDGPPCGLIAQGTGATLYTSNTVSGYCCYAVHEAYGPAAVYIGNHTYAGNAAIAIVASFGGFVGLTAYAVYTFSTSVTVQYFVYAAANGSAEVPMPPWRPTYINPGYCTGTKFDCSANGVIVSQGAGVNYFPGNVAGVTNYGGQYI